MSPDPGERGSCPTAASWGRGSTGFGSAGQRRGLRWWHRAQWGHSFHARLTSSQAGTKRHLESLSACAAGPSAMAAVHRPWAHAVPGANKRESPEDGATCPFW